MMLTLFTLFTLFILFTIQTTLHHTVSDIVEMLMQWRSDLEVLLEFEEKSVMNLFLRISMAYNVISCREVAKNTQILKFAGVLITIIVIIISTFIFITIILIIGCMSPPTPTWLDRSDHFCSAPLHHHHHHHHRDHICEEGLWVFWGGDRSGERGQSPHRLYYSYTRYLPPHQNDKEQTIFLSVLLSA